MTVQEKFEEIASKKGLVDSLDEVCETVSELLEWMATSVKRTEPYATVTIRELERSAYQVWSMPSDGEDYKED